MRAFSWCTLGLLGVLACAPSGGGSADGEEADAGTVAPALTSLEILPADAELVVDHGVPAAQAYTAIAHYADGTTADVTASTVLTIDQPSLANFTGTERVAPVSRATLDTPENAPVIMSMGRFVPRKGFHTLIQAIAKVPDAYLWLVGDGEERGNLEKLAADLGVSKRVRFAGWQKDTRPFLAASDIFVMASSHEPLGNVILEAWAQGTPVVSSRSEGPQWFMRDGENGLMVDIGDADGFAQAIDRIANDTSLGERLAARGHETLMNQFSKQAITDAYLKLFASKR